LKKLDLNNLSKKQTIELNLISKEIILDFHKLIENVFHLSDKSLYWIVNSVVSRNNYYSTLFFDLCLIEFFKQTILREKYDLIIVPSNRLKNVMNSFLKKNGITIPIESNEFFFNKLFLYLKFFKSFIHNFFMSVGLLLASNKLRRRKIKTEKLILVETWITKTEFSNGLYEPIHYSRTGFWNNLNLNQKNSFYFLPKFSFSLNEILLGWISKSEKSILKAEEKFLFKHDFLNYDDYFFALFNPFKINKIDFSSFKFRNLEIGELLAYDFKQNLSNNNSFLGLLNYRFFYKLNKSNISIDKIISWFENQPIDKGFSLGVNSFFPSTNFIGFQNYVISYDYCLFIQPTILEEKTRVIPPKIGVIGKKIIPIIKKFNDNLNVVLLPGFRFSHLTEKHTFRKKNNILIALPIDLDFSERILFMLDKIMNSLTEFEIIIRPHPDTNINYILKKFPNLKVKFSSGPLGPYLLNTKILISAGSTVCVEALCYGIKVCLIASKSKLIQNPIPVKLSQDMWDVCYDSDDLLNNLNKFVNSKTPDTHKLTLFRKKIKSDYFESVTKDKLIKFLKI
jgi:hypothetical protein